jgi:hypothetical protein
MSYLPIPSLDADDAPRDSAAAAPDQATVSADARATGWKDPHVAICEAEMPPWH